LAGIGAESPNCREAIVLKEKIMRGLIGAVGAVAVLGIAFIFRTNIEGLFQPASAATASHFNANDLPTAADVEGMGQAWGLVTDQDGTAIYLAPTRYRLLSDGQIGLFEKFTGKASEPDAATVYFSEYDCSHMTTTNVLYYRLNAAGKVAGGHRFQGSEIKRTNLSPDMAGWSISQPVCKALGLI
jgi:hypothetical protein